MSVPLELKLAATASGPRLSWAPIRELAKLRTKATHAGNIILQPGDKNPLQAASGELLDVVAVLEPAKAAKLTLTIRGVALEYDAAKQELTVNGHRAAAPLKDGKLHLRILADPTAVQILASGR